MIHRPPYLRDGGVSGEIDEPMGSMQDIHDTHSGQGPSDTGTGRRSLAGFWWDFRSASNWAEQSDSVHGGGGR